MHDAEPGGGGWNEMISFSDVVSHARGTPKNSPKSFFRRRRRWTQIGSLFAFKHFLSSHQKQIAASGVLLPIKLNLISCEEIFQTSVIKIGRFRRQIRSAASLNNFEINLGAQKGQNLCEELCCFAWVGGTRIFVASKFVLAAEQRKNICEPAKGENNRQT